MLSWDSKYMLQVIPSNDFLKLISDAKDKINSNNIEEIEKLENTYFDKINQINTIENNKEDLEKMLKMSSLELIKEEYQLVKLFSKYSLQQNNYEVNFLLKILNLLFKISDELRKRLNQTEITHKNRKDKPITRCSYKFCNFKSECNYHYFGKKCNSDHFVHNMVSADLKNLINFFKDKNDKEFVSNKEVIKSINTILYVISHMESELSDSCRYESKENWEKYHI